MSIYGRVRSAIGAGSSSSPTNRSAQEARTTFFYFFLSGSILICILKALSLPALVVTAAPCLLMIAYFVVVWDFENKRPLPTSNGDDLYYLGFLYTLTSLGYSLATFSISQDASSIVTNFGVAVATTILGMALRVYMGSPDEFNQIHQVEAAARSDLATTARELRAELRYTVGIWKDFREKDLQGLRRCVTEVDAELKHGLENFQNSLAAGEIQSGAIVSKLNDLGSSAGRGLGVLRSQTEETVSSLVAVRSHFSDASESLGTLGGAVQQVTAAVEDCEKAIDDHTASLHTETSRIGKLVRDFSALASSQRIELGESARVLRAELTETANVVRGLREGYLGGLHGLMVKAQEELRRDLVSIRAQLAEDGNRISEVVSHAIERAIQLERAVSLFESGATNVSAALAARSGEIDAATESVRSLERTVRGLQAAGDRTISVTEDHTKRFTAVSARIREALESEARRISSVDLAKGLATAAAPATQALGDVVNQSAVVVSALKEAGSAHKEAVIRVGKSRDQLHRILETHQSASSELVTVSKEFREAARSMRVATEQIGRFIEAAKGVPDDAESMSRSVSESGGQVRSVHQKPTQAEEDVSISGRGAPTPKAPRHVRERGAGLTTSRRLLLKCLRFIERIMQNSEDDRGSAGR